MILETLSESLSLEQLQVHGLANSELAGAIPSPRNSWVAGGKASRATIRGLLDDSAGPPSPTIRVCSGTHMVEEESWPTHVPRI